MMVSNFWFLVGVCSFKLQGGFEKFSLTAPEHSQIF